MTEILEQTGLVAENAVAVAPAAARPDGPIVQPVPTDNPIPANQITMRLRVVDLLVPVVEISPAPVNLPVDHSPFDLDVGSLRGVTKVRIELADPRFTLRVGEYSITAGDDDSAMVLRRGSSSAGSAEFFVTRGVNTVSFNIGLRARATNLDFYLDPKIENNG